MENGKAPTLSSVDSNLQSQTGGGKVNELPQLLSFDLKLMLLVCILEKLAYFAAVRPK